MDLVNQLKLTRRYLKYFFSADTRYAVHSPFVFELVEKVFRDKRKFYAYDEVEALRQQLLHNNQLIEITDFGAGSLIQQKRQRRVSSIARTAAKPPKYGRLLFRLVNYFQPQTILELGTSLGLSTAYLAKANRRSRLITMEGDPAVAQLAQQNFKLLKLSHIKLITGNFDNELEDVLDNINQLDFAFIDGNHRQEPTVRYFEQCLQKAGDNSVFIFDDIHWTAEMEAAWEMIKAYPAVTLSIDLFFIGLVFFRKDFLVKQHFVIRY